MVLNKSGQAVFFLSMIAIVVLILALAFAPVLNQVVVDARNVSTTDSVGLDCGNSSISDYDKANCVMVDLQTPFFILGLIALVGIIWGGKLLLT